MHLDGPAAVDWDKVNTVSLSSRGIRGACRRPRRPARDGADAPKGVLSAIAWREARAGAIDCSFDLGRRWPAMNRRLLALQV